MKKVLSVVAIVLGFAVGIFCFLVVIRMLLHFDHVISSLRLGDPSHLLAFLIYVLLVGVGIFLIIMGRKLYRSS